MTKEKEWVISAFNPYTTAANAGYNETPISQEKRSGIGKSNYPRSEADGDEYI